MLTKRLAACAKLVTPGGVVCDVGTDHGSLPAYLLQQNICHRAVATDIHKGPLEAARRTLTEAGVLERAELLLCDGLEDVCPDGITDVVIAGMGGETIVHILEQCPWRQSVRLILQPMTKASLLRQWLGVHGFDWQDSVICEGQRYYQLLCADYTGTSRVLSPLEQELGVLTFQTAEEQAYAAQRLAHFRRIAGQTKAVSQTVSQQWQSLAEALEQKLEGIL